MTALQQRMLELVLEIDEICRKHDIVYYLSGGSVLGTVRHKGFIPWDDDIDIMMTRDNYEKFVKACETDMGDDREIISMMNTPCHTKVTIKFMNKATTQFFRSQTLDTTGCGISLDIMILDPLPRDEKLKEEHIGDYIVFNELLTPFFMVNEYLYKHVDQYNKCYAEASKSPEAKREVMTKLYNKLFVEEPEETDYYLYRWGQMLLIYHKDLFGKQRYMSFDGHMLPLPEKTLEFLRVTYGDNWIYLPPPGSRDTHNSNVNANIAYCNFLKDIQMFQKDRDKMLSDFVNRKKHNVAKAVPDHDQQVNNFRQNALLIQLEFELTEEYAYDTLAALDDKALLQRVDKYLLMQLNGGYMKNQIFIDIEDRTIELIAGALLRQGEFVKADKLMKIRGTQDRALTEGLEEIQAQIDAARKFVRFFEDSTFAAGEIGNPEKLDAETVDSVKDELTALCTKYPKHLNLLRCQLQLYLAMKDMDAEDAKGAIAHAEECHPEDYEIAFWAGRIHEKLGETEKAFEYFNKAVGTANGVIMHNLIDRNVEGADNID